METFETECCGILYVTSLCGEKNFTVKPQKKPPLDFTKTIEIIKDFYSGKPRGRLACDFRVGNVSVSLLRNFSMNITGVESAEEALKLYSEILTTIIDKQSK